MSQPRPNTPTCDSRSEAGQTPNDATHPIRLLDRDAKRDRNDRRSEESTHKFIQPAHRDADVFEDESAQTHNDGVADDGDMSVGGQLASTLSAQRCTYDTHRICFSVGRGLI